MAVKPIHRWGKAKFRGAPLYPTAKKTRVFKQKPRLGFSRLRRYFCCHSHVRPNVRAKVAPTVWRAGTAAQNWGEAPAPHAQCATPLGLTLSEGLGGARGTDAMLCPMNARVDHVLEDLLRLSAEERSAVAAALIDSLETGEEASVAEAWRTELLLRREQLLTGVVQAAPWSEVRARMSAM
jgi:putative addiction module component (TIGR02574 family)